MIESIFIKNFRGIRSGKIDRFRQCNLLVGPNNSGKTTLLEALYLASTVGRPAGLVVQNEGKDTYDVQIPTEDLLGYHPLVRVWTRHNYAPEQRNLGQWLQGILQIKVKDRKSHLTSFDLTSPPGFVKGEERVIGLFGLEPQKRKDQEPDTAADLAADLLPGVADPFVNKRLLFCWHPELTYYYQGSTVWLVKGKMAVAQHTLFYDSTSIQGHLPLAFYETMLGTIPGWTQKIARHFANVFGLDKPVALQFLPTGPDRRQVQGWVAPEDRPAIPIDAFGDGARAAFKLLAPLVALAEQVHDKAPGILLWEEPESFQNPKTLARLLKEVILIVMDKPIQLFMASHSLETVAHITNMLQSRQLPPDSTLVFRLDLKDGQLISSWFDKETLQVWLHEGFDPRVWDDFEQLELRSLRYDTLSEPG